MATRSPELTSFSRRSKPRENQARRSLHPSNSAPTAHLKAPPLSLPFDCRLKALCSSVRARCHLVRRPLCPHASTRFMESRMTPKQSQAAPSLAQEEALIFELSQTGRRGMDLPPSGGPRARPHPRAFGPQTPGSPARSQRAHGHAPLRAAEPVELRHRPGHVPARLVHHEIQPQSQRGRRCFAPVQQAAPLLG